MGGAGEANSLSHDVQELLDGFGDERQNPSESPSSIRRGRGQCRVDRAGYDRIGASAGRAIARARADRRRSLLQLSQAGKRVYAQVVPFALAYERALIAPLSAQERATIDRA